MKKIRSSFLLAAALVAAPVATTLAQTPPAVTTTLAAVRNAPADQHAVLIRNAVAADPRIAPDLVAALIAAFPAQAAEYTTLVAQALIAQETLSIDERGAILTDVARSAVDAALAIPPAAVEDLLATVNSVKTALAALPPEFLPFVADYLELLESLPDREVGGTGSPSGDDSLLSTPRTQTILSKDTFVP
jgi:hypothetical protein